MSALRSYRLLMTWQTYRLATFLPLAAVVQLIFALGIVLGYPLLFPELDEMTVLFLATGAPAITLISMGLVALPQVVAQARLEGALEYMRSLPIPRLVYLAADLTVWLLIVLPGVVFAVVLGAWAFDLSLEVSLAIVPARPPRRAHRGGGRLRDGERAAAAHRDADHAGAAHRRARVLAVELPGRPPARLAPGHPFGAAGPGDGGGHPWIARRLGVPAVDGAVPAPRRLVRRRPRHHVPDPAPSGLRSHDVTDDPSPARTTGPAAAARPGRRHLVPLLRWPWVAGRRAGVDPRPGPHSPGVRMDRSLLARTAIVIALAGSALLAVAASAQDEPDAAALTAKLQQSVDRLPDAPAGDDADELRALIGPPDAFTIAFEEGDDGSVGRREQWLWGLRSRHGLRVRRRGDPRRPAPRRLRSACSSTGSIHDPSLFTAGATWDELAAVLPDPDAFEAIPLDAGYGVDATVRVGDLLQLAFDADGELFYVEAVAVTGELVP